MGAPQEEEIRSYVIRFIRSRVGSEYEADVAVLLGICLECGGNLVEVDGEVVCSKCGLVWCESQLDERIPFSDSNHYEDHWQPSLSLNYQKLGTLNGRNILHVFSEKERARMRVIVDSDGNGKVNPHLGIRTRIIKQIVVEEPPALRRVLERISYLLRKLELDNCWSIAEYSASLARKLIYFSVACNINRIPTSLADAIVALALKQFDISRWSDEIKVTRSDLAFVRFYQHMAAILKRQSKRYATI